MLRPFSSALAIGGLLSLGLLAPVPGHAQESRSALPGAATRMLDGSPAPVAPETITRDERRRATIRAIRLEEPLVLDGRLDEAAYAANPPFGGFIQSVPLYGDSISERTEAWVLHDDTHIYVSCRCWDRTPPERWMANELRRDSNGLRQNDHFGVMFDTFYDRRNGVMFYSNPLGARFDFSVVDEGSVNIDWNPVWDVRTDRFEGGWTIEMAIPFKSLRYRSGEDEVWGIQLRRTIRHKNEWSYLTPVPEVLAGPQALNRVSSGGTLVGLRLPEASRNLEIKPYLTGGLRTDRVSSPAVDGETRGDLGFDLKFGLTANLTADLTVNTDFAQVEVDEQQVNLTRFSLFFPEKREFFLEGRGVFDFGRSGQSEHGGFFGGSDTPYLFYSRRIGLDGGTVVPIDLGGRLTGKVGPWSVGVVNIRTAGVAASGIDAADFSVVRLKRDVLERSALGVMFTNRSTSLLGDGASQAWGVDGTFSPSQDVRLTGYLARTRTPGLEGDPSSYEVKAEYSTDPFGVDASVLRVGDAFNPEIGFVRRDDFRKFSGQVRGSHRPGSIAAVRRMNAEVSGDYFENGSGVIESRTVDGRFNVEFENSDRFNLSVGRSFERLDEPFAVASGVEVAPGDYSFSDVSLWLNFGGHRRVSGALSLRRGSFYDGTITGLGYGMGRVVLSNHFSIEPGATLNFISLPSGKVAQRVFRTRADYAFTPRMFVSTLVQYNSTGRTFSTNLRYRWEYSPGSEIFVVWTDERELRGAGGPGGALSELDLGGGGLRNRALIIKVNRLLRF